MTELSQRGKRFQYDVIVIGSGLAGLHYIEQLSQIAPQTKIALITKQDLANSNSHYAQGGIAAVWDPNDSIEQHVEDTLQAGKGLSNPNVVEQVVTASKRCIEELIASGVELNCDAKGNYDLGNEGGHSQRRVLHNGDQTGAAIMQCLIAKVQTKAQVDIFENHTVVNLITEQAPHQPGSRRTVTGCYVLDNLLGFIHCFAAGAVILACGGIGKTYRYTSNPTVATGDGVAMAYRAGARVGNMEFVQFHPTLLYHPSENHFLISEAVRGEGAYLRDPITGERFMQKYDSQRLELSTRDIVARAIFTEIEHGQENFVHLDLTHLDPNMLQQRFPRIYQTLAKHGINICTDKIPVVPAAHYLCGGVLTDLKGQTDLAGLYAIGETAFTGLHGANRLASNSLLECVVMAGFAAKHSHHWLQTRTTPSKALRDWDSNCVMDLRRASQINAHWRGLRSEMTSYAGIVRTEAGLKDLRTLIKARQHMIENYYWHYTITRDLIELRNILLVSKLIVHAALKRKESRGVHYREDFPDTGDSIKEIIFTTTTIGQEYA